MFEAFLLTITALLAIVGLSELLHSACYRILKPRVKAQNFLLTVLTEEDAENQMLGVIEELRWHGTRYADTLVAVTINLSDEKKAVCKSRFSGPGIIFTDNIEVIQHKFRRK